MRPIDTIRIKSSGYTNAQLWHHKDVHMMVSETDIFTTTNTKLWPIRVPVKLALQLCGTKEGVSKVFPSYMPERGAARYRKVLVGRILH